MGAAFVAWHSGLGSLVLRSSEGGLLLYDLGSGRPLVGASPAALVAVGAAHGYRVVSR